MQPNLASDLRLVIMPATLEAETYQASLKTAPPRAQLGIMTLIYDNLYLASLAETNVEAESRSLGVTHIVNVAQDIVVDRVSQGYSYLHLGVCDDDPQNDITTILDPCVRWIHQGCESGGKVLVHCWSGVSRSAIVIMAYLVSQKSKSAVDAYHMVVARRRTVDPWPGYLQQFQAWAKLRNSTAAIQA